MGVYRHNRNGYFFLWWTLSLALFGQGLASLVTLSWNDDRYSHIILIPLVSLGLIWLERNRIFLNVQYCFWPALPVALGVVVYSGAKAWFPNLDPDLMLLLTGSVLTLTWIGGFVFFYGTRCAKAAVFPLGLLLLVIPLPPTVVEIAEVALQKGSAEVTHFLFLVASTPVYRDGLVFALPGVNIEVAKECSGIRAAFALLITALLLSYFLLRSNWRRACCVMLVIPIAIFKNAVRIAILSWLGVYASADYLTGDLHHRGGIVFSTISLALLLPAVWMLRRTETVARPEGTDLSG